MFSRELFRGRGLKLIEEKVKPAFKKIHDYYVEVSKSLKSILRIYFVQAHHRRDFS